MNNFYDMKCFIEGVRIPISAATRITSKKGVICTVDLVSTPQLYQIPPRSHVAVYYKKKTQTEKNYTGNTEKSGWKLYFEGYYDSYDLSTAVENRFTRIICSGVDSYKNHEKIKINSIDGTLAAHPYSVSLTTFHGFGPNVKNDSKNVGDKFEQFLYEKTLTDSSMPELNPYNVFVNSVNESNQIGDMVGKIISGVMTSNRFLQKMFRTQNTLNRYGVLGNKEIFHVMKHEQFKKYVHDHLANSKQMNPQTTVDMFFRAILGEIFYDFVYVPSPSFTISQEHKVPDVIKSDILSGDEFKSEEYLKVKPTEVKGNFGAFKAMQVIVTPDLFFAAPPKCNMIFPSDNTSFSGGRQFMAEPTRLMVHDGGFLAAAYFGRNDLNTRLSYRPGNYGDDRDIVVYGIDANGKILVNKPTSEEIRLETNRNSDSPKLSRWMKDNFSFEQTYKNDELYKGIIAEEAGFNRNRVSSNKKENEKEAYTSVFDTQVDNMFAKLTQSSMKPTLQMEFNPNLVCGLPGTYSDESIGHVVGEIEQITDTISVRGESSTVVVFSRVRILPFDGNDVRAELQHSEIDRLNNIGSSGNADYMSDDFSYKKIGKTYKKLFGVESAVDYQGESHTHLIESLNYWFNNFTKEATHEDKSRYVESVTSRSIITEGQHMLYILGARESEKISFDRKIYIDTLINEYKISLKSSKPNITTKELNSKVKAQREHLIDKYIINRDGNEYYGTHGLKDGPEKSFEPFSDERRKYVKKYKASLSRIPSENKRD